MSLASRARPTLAPRRRADARPAVARSRRSRVRASARVGRARIGGDSDASAVKPIALCDRLVTLPNVGAVRVASTRVGSAVTVTVTLDDAARRTLGAGAELHWGARAADGTWTRAPDRARASGGSREYGDGIARRSAFDADGVVTLRVDDAEGEGCACAVGIVTAGDAWAHASDGDLVMPLRVEGGGGGGGLREMARRASELEGGSVNLFYRFCAVDDALDAALEAGPEGAALVFSWLRLSSLKQLHWYAGNNYQGKDMASKQERLAWRVARAAATTADPTSRGFMRASLAFLPRGGGNGDDIRMGILNIMRTHGIKEGHRPGIEDPFIAQWHQKLHSNTTPDDVKICEAYLHFLHTGNWDDFWAHLWHNGGLTREDLAGMKAGWRSDGIHGPALHMPHMIDSFKHYLWVLKTTHGGGDVDSAMNFARHGLPGDVAWEVDDLLRNRDAWWVPGKIVEIRKKLLGVWQHDSPNRDVVMLDATLEKFFRTKVEACDYGQMSSDDVLSLLELSLVNVALTNESPRISTALKFVQSAMGGERWSKSWSETMDAALDFCALAMEADMDFLCRATQNAADVIASKSTKTDPKYLINFGEENVRSHSLFVVSQLISRLRPIVRAAAGRSPWQIVSVGDASLEAFAGTAKIATLSDIQGEDFSSEPMVCITETLGGLEDIPAGVRAVVTRAPVDLLSHIAIRARNTNVLLASVADDALWASVLETAGNKVRCAISGEDLKIEVSNVTETPATAGAAAPATKISIAPYKPSDAWMIAPTAYARDVVGGKSNSLSDMAKELAGMNMANVSVPGSFALPFGTFERALEEDEETRAALDEAVAAIGSAANAEKRREALGVAREIIATRLMCPRDLEVALRDAAASLSPSVDIERLWDAVCGVWASKWTERAWLSRKACGIPDADLNVAVLLMELVDAEFAFVVHTANPITGNADEIFGEICVGLGETLVGNAAGSALGFTVSKSTGDITIRSLPSKLCGHFAPSGGTIIARSDSNGEDLEDFAGAGLYDSITAEPTEERLIDYTGSSIVWDSNARESLIRRIADVAKAIERGRGKPQDIEGAIVGERIVLLQTRAQIC